MKVWSKTHILNTLFITIAHLEKNIWAIEKKVATIFYHHDDQVMQTFSYLDHGWRKKVMIFPQQVFFNIFWLKCHMTLIFLWNNLQSLAHLLGTFNVVVKLEENFLSPFKTKVAAENMRFCQNILHEFELHFSKSQLFWFILTYNQIGAS